MQRDEKLYAGNGCKILALYEERKIWLKPNHFNSLGNNPYDGASSLSNIRDTCYGRSVKRYGRLRIISDDVVSTLKASDLS